MKTKRRQLFVVLLSVVMVLSYMLAVIPTFAATGDTYSVSTATTNNATGAESGMYSMDEVYVTEQADGTYLVRMHQANKNRNVLAFTDDINIATSHGVDWYQSDSNYWFTVPVKSLDTPIVACFSSTDRIASGNKFGNPMAIAFDKDSMKISDKSPAVASDINLKTAPTGLTLSTSKTGLASGATIKLTPTLNPVGSIDKITWSSNNPDIAKVVNGVVTGVAKGEATITATVGTYTATCSVSVDPDLTIENTTGMFNVVSASFETIGNKTYLRFALNSTGYENLFVGTFEEAEATTSGSKVDDSNWVKFTKNAAGKYEFVVPVSDGQSFIPIQALSKNYVAKGEYRWYSRQIAIDWDNDKLIAGDYDQEKAIELANNATSFNVVSAALETVGGHWSNNYQEILKLKMNGATFDKAYIGSANDAKAFDAAKSSGDIISIDGSNTFAIALRANKLGGQTLYDYLDKKVTVAFHDTTDNTWKEKDITVSKTGGTVLIVDASKDNVITGNTPSNGSQNSNVLTGAIDKTGKTPKTGDEAPIALMIALLLVAGTGTAALYKKNK